MSYGAQQRHESVARGVNAHRRLDALIMLKARLPRTSFLVPDAVIGEALTNAQWRELISPRCSTSWTEMDNLQKEGLKEYLIRLESADLLNRKKKRLAKKRGPPWHELRAETEAAYLQAMEALEEILAKRPLLAIGLFPQPDFSVKNMIWLDFRDMPRLTEIERKKGRKLFGRGPFWHQEVLVFVERVLQRRFPTSQIRGN